ncbi:hypothetical protein MNB_SV-8-1073 [hydrothermal vent metagenome]|uniref:Uncharacterized protein n=1 Tax=hydrothermal vent metagenome TaxID=652676 RepID=A0A1W1B8Q1_9ZZZZ
MLEMISPTFAPHKTEEKRNSVSVKKCLMLFFMTYVSPFFYFLFCPTPKEVGQAFS